MLLVLSQFDCSLLLAHDAGCHFAFHCRLNWKEHIAKKRKQIDLKTKEIKWVTGKRIPYIYKKQTTHLQSGNQTYMKLRNRIVGLRQPVQHSHHAEIPVQNSQSHSKYTPVRNKLYSTYRLQLSLLKLRHP
jgi:hypothetical protein